MRELSSEEIAEQFHDAYETRAPEHGYETREASAKPWADTPEQNKSLMIDVVQNLIDNRIIHPGVIDVLRSRDDRHIETHAEHARAYDTMMKSHDQVLRDAMNELHPGIDLS